MSSRKSSNLRTSKKRNRTKATKPRNLVELTERYVDDVRERQELKRKQFAEERKKAALEQSTIEAANKSLLEGPDVDHNVPMLLNKMRELVDPIIRGTEDVISDYKKYAIDLARAFNQLDCATNLMYAWEHARVKDVCPHIQQLQIARNSLQKNLAVAKNVEQYFSELPNWLLR